MDNMKLFNTLFADVCDSEKPIFINEALGLTNNVQKMTQPLQHIVDVTGLHPMQGASLETTDDVGNKSLFMNGIAHDFPAPLDAIEDPMKRTAKGIIDMIEILSQCRKGLITNAQRDLCDEYITFFGTLLREVFQKRMALDIDEIGG